MNQLSKKAIASILSLVLVFVALGATTFAWFTLGTTATVGQFDLTARGSEGLEISLDGDNWYSTINSGMMEQLLYGEDGIFKDGKLDAVTTKNGKEFELFEEINQDGNLVTTPIMAPNENYLEFELKFQTMERGAKLNLNDILFQSKTIDWKPDVTYINENGNTVPVSQTGDKITLTPHYASRVSFEDSDTNVVSTFQDKLVPGTGLTMGNVAYERDNGAHSYIANKVGKTTESITQLLEANLEHKNYVNNALQHKGLSVDERNLLTFIDPETTDPEELKTTFSTASVIVRIWIEGWDSNTYDSIFNANFIFGFEFGLTLPTEP